MTFLIDDNGNITLVQGDSGRLVVNGIPTDKNYQVFLAFQDENRKILGQELSKMSNMESSVDFHIPAELTDLFKVPLDEEFYTYYYGIKLCYSSTGYEDTVLLGVSQVGDKNTVTVYPKKVEGI